MDNSEFFNRVISKNNRKFDNEHKKTQFPLYIDRCKLIYKKYANKKNTILDFWEVAIRDLQIKSHMLSNPYSKIYNDEIHLKVVHNREFFHACFNFTSSMRSIYTQNKIIQAIKDIAPIEKIDFSKISKFANPQTTCEWNIKNVGHLKDCERLIKGKMTVKQFIGVKKTMKKSQLTFKIFFKRFFPGCELHETKKGVDYVDKKCAMDYYKDYIKSGLPYSVYDKSTSI